MQTILQPKSLTTGPPRIRHAQLPNKIANIVFDTWPIKILVILQVGTITKTSANKVTSSIFIYCFWCPWWKVPLLPFLHFPSSGWNFGGPVAPNLLPLNPVAATPALLWLGTLVVLAIACSFYQVNHMPLTTTINLIHEPAWWSST